MTEHAPQPVAVSTARAPTRDAPAAASGHTWGSTSALFEELDALEFGETWFVPFHKLKCAVSVRNKLAWRYSQKRARKMRSHVLSDGILFVRVDGR